MSTPPRPPTDEVSTEVYAAQPTASPSPRAGRATQRGVEPRRAVGSERDGGTPHSLEEIETSDFIRPESLDDQSGPRPSGRGRETPDTDNRDTLREIPERDRFALGSIDDPQAVTPDDPTGDVTRRTVAAAPLAPRRLGRVTAAGVVAAKSSAGPTLNQLPSGAAARRARAPVRERSLPAEVAAHAREVDLASGSGPGTLEVRDTVREMPQGRVVHGTLQPMPRRQLDAPTLLDATPPGSSAEVPAVASPVATSTDSTVVSEPAAPRAPVVSNQSEPLRVISMKAPTADAGERKEVELKEHKVVLRPPESIRPQHPTPPGGLGFLAPPRDEKAAQARNVRELAIWGCVVVMVGSVVMVVVWLLAR